MAYTPTNWKSGDTVTSTKLNKIEQGVSDATTAAEGAITAPSSPTTGQYLKWNGSAWVADTLPLYNGGVS